MIVAINRARPPLCTRNSLGVAVMIFCLWSNLTIVFFSSSAYQNDSAGKLSGSGVDELSKRTQTKELVIEILLPSEPDTGVEERLMKRIRVAAKKREISPLANCSTTSQVRILQYSDDSWKLISLDTMGNNKTVGGDEYYVTYTDVSSSNTTLVAFAHDNGEGSYTLDFSTTPMNPVNITGYGNLTVYLQYTCGIGAMGQPVKNKWVTGGSCEASWSRDNITTPSYRIFSPPTDSGIDFSPYSLVIGYGDSLIEGLFRHKYTKTMYLYRPNTTSYHAGTDLELNNKTVDLLMDKLREWHNQELNQSNVALVTGSAVWDLLSKDTVDPDFASHLEGVRQYVKRLQQEYPNVPLYWKAPSPFHAQQLPSNCHTHPTCKWRTKYLSNSRARVLYEKQKSLMAELGIPFLDLWEAYYLSGDHMLTVTDGRHYSSALNILMQSWFYRGN